MQRYQRIIMRAHEAFQHRLKQVEIELVEAQHALDLLDIQALSHDRRTAVIMGQDARLGENSPLRLLPEEIVREIVWEAGMLPGSR